MASLGILTIATGAVTAPAGIWFEAVDIAGFAAAGGPAPGSVYDPSFHEITYIWTINGSPLAPYSAPQNMVTGWNDPNVAYGKKVAFHFPDPGTYQIDLWAVDRTGTTGIASTTLTVADPDTVYSGTRTVCYSNAPGESWSGEKPGCQRITSFGALQNAINAASGPLRILFKRSQVISEATNGSMRVTGASQWLNHIGAWGSGAKPVLTGRNAGFLIEFKNANPVTHFTCENIDFQGDWDAASETGVSTPTPFYLLESETACRYTISQCSFNGFSSVWFGTRDSASVMIVADCVATNWRDYGTFIHSCPQQKFALIGSRFQQNVDAQNGSPPPWGKNGFYNDHGPLRYAHLSDCYLACCDFFSRNGWSPVGTDKADQPCLRINATPIAAPSDCTIERCVCEGGYQVVTLEGNNTGITEYPGNYLIDRALLIATSKTFKSFVTMEFGGTTLRNVVGVLPDVPAYHSNSWFGSFMLEAQRPGGGNLDAPVEVYGCSVINLRNGANDPGHDWPMITQTAAFTDTTFENNVAHAPGLSPAITAPVTLLTETGVTPRYKGVLYNEFGQEDGTFGSTVGNGGSFTLAYPSGTNQSYWQATQSQDTRHTLSTGNVRHHATLGAISVSFEGSAIRVTNTSGQTWNAGTPWALKLDRKSRKSVIPATYATPPTVPLPKPQSTIGGGLGLIPYDDFHTDARTARSSGAIEP